MFLGVAFIALSAWACGALLNANNTGKVIRMLLAIWGWVWWVSAGLVAIDEYLPSKVFPHASLIFIAFTSLVLPMVSTRLKWPALSKLSGLLLPVMVIVLVIDSFMYQHPFDYYGLYSWGITFAVYAVLLMRHDMPNAAVFRAALIWMAAIIGGLEWQHYITNILGGVWRFIGWGILPLILVAGVMYWQRNENAYRRAWLWVGTLPVMLFLCAWFMLASLNSDGNANPLPYIPLLNPLDITLAAIVLMLIRWERSIRTYFASLQSLIPVLAGLMGFTLLNGMLLRTLHHWVGTPFQWTAIFGDSVVQMAFTFLWAISAFILMLLAHKREFRPLWMTGAALMGLVVAKIFLLDLAQHGTVERIASFMGAGLMLLVMGYFAPLPPAKADAQTKETI